MRRLVLIAALLSGPAWGAITLDSTTCAGGVVTGCPTEHVSNSGVYTGGTANVPFPTSISCGAAGTVLYAVVLDESHGVGTTTSAPQVAVGTAGNYSTAWTLVTGSNVASLDGGASIYRAVCSGAFTGEVPRLIVGCTGGTSTCATGTAAGLQESHVQVYGFTAVFGTPGNATTGHSTAGTPSLTLTTTAGDKILMSWSDFTGGSCTQTLTSGAAVVDAWATLGTAPAPCNSGNSDYYVSQWTSGTTSAGSTTMGVTAPTGAFGAWTAVEICDSTASACPNSGGGPTLVPRGKRSMRGAGAKLHRLDALPIRKEGRS